MGYLDTAPSNRQADLITWTCEYGKRGVCRSRTFVVEAVGWLLKLRRKREEEEGAGDWLAQHSTINEMGPPHHLGV